MFFEPSDFHARRVTIWKCLPIAQRVDAVAPSTVSHAHFATVMHAVVLSDIFILWSLNGAPLYLATCFIRLSSVNAARPYDVHRVSWCCCRLRMQFDFNHRLRALDNFMMWSLNGAPLYLGTRFIGLSSVNAARPYHVHRFSWCCCRLWMQFDLMP